MAGVRADGKGFPPLVYVLERCHRPLADRTAAPCVSRDRPSVGGSFDMTADVRDIATKAPECPAARASHPEEGGGEQEKSESFRRCFHVV
jgi:hypothetical protein